MKSSRIGIGVLVLSLGITGCARITARVVEKPRVDQELQQGNRGYLVGKPPAAAPRRETRQVIQADIEMATLKEMDPFPNRKASAPLAAPASSASAPVSIPVEPAAPSDTDLTEGSIPQEAVSSTAPSETSVTQEPAPATYTVKSGDTLEKIAAKVYGDSSQWHRIYEANRDTLKSPNRLYPGQRLVIPPARAGHKRHVKSQSTLK